MHASGCSHVAVQCSTVQHSSSNSTVLPHPVLPRTFPCPPSTTSVSCHCVTVWPAMAGKPCPCPCPCWPAAGPPPSEGWKGRVATWVHTMLRTFSFHTSDR